MARVGHRVLLRQKMVEMCKYVCYDIDKWTGSFIKTIL